MSKGMFFYVGGFELPNKNAAAYRALSNAKIFRELGYDVTLVGIDSARLDGGLQPCAQRFSDFECYSVPYPNSIRSWIRHLTAPHGLIKLLAMPYRERILGVICYNYPAIAQWRIRRLCWTLGIKHIADATEWYDSSAGSILYRGLKWFDTAARMYFIHDRADGILTTSKFLSDFYLRRGKIITELPTLYDCMQLKQPPRIAEDGPKRFIYAGTPFHADYINKERSNMKERLDLSIHLFYRLLTAGYDFRFDIFGIDKQTYLRVFPEHAHMLESMQQKVVYHGRQPNNLVLEKIQRSDFSILFRDINRVTLAGFPTKVAESITLGTPVITNKIPSLERYDGIPGLFLTNMGEEYALLERFCTLSRIEIIQLKQKTYQSGAFDYRKFSSEISKFLGKIGVR
jgi:glycosyltransferase involved in cell wall biosynthesis